MPFVANIRAPTLLIGGSEDVMTPVDTGARGAGFREVLDVVPRSELKIIAGSGHHVVLEQPEEVARLISEFVLGDLDGFGR